LKIKKKNLNKTLRYCTSPCIWASTRFLQSRWTIPIWSDSIRFWFKRSN